MVQDFEKYLQLFEKRNMLQHSFLELRCAETVWSDNQRFAKKN